MFCHLKPPPTPYKEPPGLGQQVIILAISNIRPYKGPRITTQNMMILPIFKYFDDLPPQPTHLPGPHMILEVAQIHHL